jgi:hypothetical protein
MKLNFEQTLGEISIVGDTPRGADNLVFPSQIFDPTTGQFAQFVRSFHPETGRFGDGSTIIVEGTRNIGSGEDPRPFYWRGSPCISAQTFSDGHGFINRIYVKNSDKWIMLITPKGLNPGKNWAPFVRDGDLYFVHAYSPFRVLKASFLSEKDDFMVLDVVAEHPVTTPVSSDRYSQFRGGSNALQIGNKVVGVGHTNQQLGDTIETIVHRPFLYIYEPDVRLDYYACDFDFPECYKIVDPTSLYLHEGQLLLMTSETEEVWSTFPQSGRSCLYSIDMNGLFDQDNTASRGTRLHWWPREEAPQRRKFFSRLLRSKTK